jgi:hypothetical protein
MSWRACTTLRQSRWESERDVSRRVCVPGASVLSDLGLQLLPAGFVLLATDLGAAGAENARGR